MVSDALQSQGQAAETRPRLFSLIAHVASPGSGERPANEPDGSGGLSGLVPCTLVHTVRDFYALASRHVAIGVIAPDVDFTCKVVHLEVR